MEKRALCIGINDYPGTANDLSGCVNDANDWAAALKAQGFSTTVLLDRQASGDGIRKGIKALLAGLKKGDSAILTYSGHGSYVPDLDGDEADGMDECICPWDIMTKGEITDDELFRLYSDRASGVKLVVFSDSCHSGTVSKAAAVDLLPPSMPKGPRRLSRFLPPSVFLKGKRLKDLGVARGIRRSCAPGRYAGLLMGGCQDAEVSFDAWFNGRANGAFTYAALLTLARLEPGTSTYQQWHKALRSVLPSQQYPQSPSLYGSSGMKKWRILA